MVCKLDISNAAANQSTAFGITDTKFPVLVVTLSVDENAKLLKQLKSAFKRTINWNKYGPKQQHIIPQTSTLII